MKYSQLYNATPCLNETEIKCAQKEFSKFIDSDISSICNEFCPLECQSQAFDYRHSMARFPSDTYAGILKQKNVFKNLSDYFESDQKVLNGMIAVNIYYSNLGYSLINESPKTSIFDIVANIGGNLFIHEMK